MFLPVVLSIAGSDNSAGAGAQADLKTCSARGVYGVTAITCVVAEVPGKVSRIQPIDPEIVAEQIRLLFGAYPIAAIKTGMLFSRPIMEAVIATLHECASAERAGKGLRVPLVVDPVMVATSGALLLQPEAVALYREALFPEATLITPNLDEAQALLGRTISSLAEMRTAAQELAFLFGTAILLKGGHLRTDHATDVLVYQGQLTEFSAPFVHEVSTHGTGCTYAAAIASELAKGRALNAAVEIAKQYVTRAVAGFLRWEKPGRRTDALHHFA